MNETGFFALVAAGIFLAGWKARGAWTALRREQARHRINRILFRA